MTPGEQFAALPESVQEQLVRIARTAAGMSTSEKQHARLFMGSVGLFASAEVGDDGMPAAEMVSACARIVACFDAASGSEASGLVV